jgi:hypothetical protein
MRFTIIRESRELSRIAYSVGGTALCQVDEVSCEFALIRVIRGCQSDVLFIIAL